MSRPVDLPRVRAALDRLDALMRDNPTLAERTARWATGELPGPTLEDTLNDDTLNDGPPYGTQVRLPGDLLARAEALRAAVRATLPELLAAGAVSRSTVIRLALIRGLDALERECNTDAR